MEACDVPRVQRRSRLRLRPKLKRDQPRRRRSCAERVEKGKGPKKEEKPKLGTGLQWAVEGPCCRGQLPQRGCPPVPRLAKTRTRRRGTLLLAAVAGMLRALQRLVPELAADVADNDAVVGPTIAGTISNVVALSVILTGPLRCALLTLLPDSRARRDGGHGSRRRRRRRGRGRCRRRRKATLELGQTVHKPLHGAYVIRCWNDRGRGGSWGETCSVFGVACGVDGAVERVRDTLPKDVCGGRLVQGT